MDVTCNTISEVNNHYSSNVHSIIGIQVLLYYLNLIGQSLAEGYRWSLKAGYK